MTPAVALPSTPSASQPWTIQDLESLALTHNASLQQIQASINQARGLLEQVGYRPNPTMGYQGMQLADRGTDQHTLFVEQEWVRGGKLAWNTRVTAEALHAQEWELESQRYRILTDLRLKFTEAVIAQRRLAQLQEFETIAKNGLEMAKRRRQGKEGSQLEVLQTGVQLDELQLLYQQAKIQYQSSLQGLAAMVGAPCFDGELGLSDTLPIEANPMDWDSVRQELVSASPELQVAYRRLQQAHANVHRQQVQSIPNLTLQVAAGVDNGTNSGMMNVQVAAPIPVYHQNQGNIAAAQAEACRAAAEIARLEANIAARLALVANEYDSARVALERYQSDILPKTQETIRLAEKAYQAGEASFLEMLTARRMYFDSHQRELQAMQQLAQSKIRLDGFLLTGALDAPAPLAADDGLRSQSFSQQ